MPTVLSTKRLRSSQRMLLLQTDISLVEYNAIAIEFVPFRAPDAVEHAIFTSQNAVLSVHGKDHKIKIKNCYCVGEKTKALLEEYGHNVVKTTEYATELADYLVENHRRDSFYFFCGNIRSDTIPERLKNENIVCEENVVYKTSLNPQKFERSFDAVLFFSPSGVRSYFETNKSNNAAICVCIGTTTASEARIYSDNVTIANSTTVESVIARVVKLLK